jgi:N-acetylmuramoyl-L-alanine amidase
VPSALLELGYMSNAGDEKQLKSAKWRESMAESTMTAIDDFFTTKVAGRGG